MVIANQRNGELVCVVQFSGPKQCRHERRFAVTTLMIDDELGQRAKRTAAAQGKTLDEFVREVLQQALNGEKLTRTVRNGLPVVQSQSATPIDPLAVKRKLEEEGF
jgi:hypothetical protein